MNSGKMATLSMSKVIGVIAEDKSDVEVVEALLSKYVSKNKFSIKRFVGDGCGKLKNKCDSWTKMLFASGCHHVFVFHDRDRETEFELRKLLDKKLPKELFPRSLIVIPIEELEAWLLSDPVALKEVFNLPKVPKAIADCEAVPSPKEFLERLIWSIGKKRYVNTMHNRKIAERVSLESLVKCSSYIPFDKYVRDEVF